MVHFKASIYVAHVPMRVRYYWERGNGVRTKARVQRITSEAHPILTVKDDWAAGAPGKSFRETARLHVITDAGEAISDTVESTGRCER